MANGYKGKILRINLTNQSISTINTSDYEEYGGGLGIGTAIFWDLCADKLPFDAYDAKNVLCIMTSPMSGTIVPSMSGRTEICGVGPQAYPTGLFSRSNFGGRFSGELKYAGWDGIVIEGASSSPVWVNIVNDKVTFEDASGLWGLDTFTAQQKIWDYVADGQKYGDWLQKGTSLSSPRTTQRPAVLCTGPIGEALVPDMGCLVHDKGNGAGQSGFGSVFGSKKLKAISVVGTGSVEIADPKELYAARDWAMDYTRGFGVPMKPGPTAITRTMYARGAATEVQGPQGCMACINPCRQRNKDGIGNESSCVDVIYYQWADAMKHGALTTAYRRAGDYSQTYGANNYALNHGIRWLYTLYNQGIVGKGKQIDTDIDFNDLGSDHWVATFLDNIVQGKDQMGIDLRQGFLRAAKKWGRLEQDLKSGILRFPYNGYPEHGYDGRWEYEWGYGSIFGERDINEHCFNFVIYYYPMWSVEPRPVTAQCLAEMVSDKLLPVEGDPRMLDYSWENMYSDSTARKVAWHRHYTSFYKASMLFCDWSWPDFCNPYGPNGDYNGITPDAEPRFINAVTGKNMTFADGVETGRKIWNLRNAIWTLQGRHRDAVKFADFYYDTKAVGNYFLPTYENGEWAFRNVGANERFFERAKVEDFKTRFYEIEGWDPNTGWPTRSTLEGLGLKKVADLLEAKGKLGEES